MKSAHVNIISNCILLMFAYHLLQLIITQLVNPNNKDIRDVPGLAPPALTRKLLWHPN